MEEYIEHLKEGWSKSLTQGNFPTFAIPELSGVLARGFFAFEGFSQNSIAKEKVSKLEFFKEKEGLLCSFLDIFPCPQTKPQTSTPSVNQKKHPNEILTELRKIYGNSFSLSYSGEAEGRPRFSWKCKKCKKYWRAYPHVKYCGETYGKHAKGGLKRHIKTSNHKEAISSDKEVKESSRRVERNIRKRKRESIGKVSSKMQPPKRGKIDYTMKEDQDFVCSCGGKKVSFVVFDHNSAHCKKSFIWFCPKTVDRCRNNPAVVTPIDSSSPFYREPIFHKTWGKKHEDFFKKFNEKTKKAKENRAKLPSKRKTTKTKTKTTILTIESSEEEEESEDFIPLFIPDVNEFADTMDENERLGKEEYSDDDDLFNTSIFD